MCTCMHTHISINVNEYNSQWHDTLALVIFLLQGVVNMNPRISALLLFAKEIVKSD